MKILILAVLLLLSGCAVVPPVYRAPGLSAKEDAAVIVLGNNNGDVAVRLLDGKKLADEFTTWNGGWAAVRELHIPAGTHTFEGFASNLANPFKVEGRVEAGRRYRLVNRIVGYGSRIELIEMEPKGKGL